MASWHKSTKLYCLFLYSSWVVVAMGLFMAFMLTPWFQGLQNSASGEIVLKVIGGSIGGLAAPASLILFFGMAIFCIREDHSGIEKKIGWFLLFFATACFGAATYFFMVFRKQIEVESR